MDRQRLAVDDLAGEESRDVVEVAAHGEGGYLVPGIVYLVKITGGVQGFEAPGYGLRAPEAAEEGQVGLAERDDAVGIAVEEHDGAGEGLPMQLLLVGDCSCEGYHSRVAESLREAGRQAVAVAAVVLGLQDGDGSGARAADDNFLRVNAPGLPLLRDVPRRVVQVHYGSVNGGLEDIHEIDGGGASVEGYPAQHGAVVYRGDRAAVAGQELEIGHEHFGVPFTEPETPAEHEDNYW